MNGLYPEPWHGLLIALRRVLEHILTYPPPGEAVSGKVEVRVEETKGTSDADMA